jgi:hypothetical protein
MVHQTWSLQKTDRPTYNLYLWYWHRRVVRQPFTSTIATARNIISEKDVPEDSVCPSCSNLPRDIRTGPLPILGPMTNCTRAALAKHPNKPTPTSKLAEAAVLLTYNQEVPGLNISWVTYCPNWCLRGFAYPFQKNAMIMTASFHILFNSSFRTKCSLSYWLCCRINRI